MFFAFEWYQQKKETAKKSEEILALNRKRTDFVANVSHELKTPLTSIKGYTETLRDGALRDPLQADKFLQKIEENSERLDRLVHDILDLSKLEATDTHLNYGDIDVETFLIGLRDQFQFRLEQKRQTLNIKNSVKILKADRHLVEQAFTNLISNAHRYCQEGAFIEISSKTININSKSWHRFEIADNGPGIPKEDLSRIFERFYRADKSRNRAFGGTGLGLAIVKHVVLSHHGSVEAKINLDEGMTFSMYFPTHPFV